MITLKNIYKTIRGNQVLENINFTFENRTIYGLYGPNGSGKTMILRIVCGLVKPTEGSIIIDDQELGKDISFPPSVGIVIENMELLPYLNAYDNLKELASIKRIANDKDIKDALKRVGLNTNKLVKSYSLGMRQRLNIAQAIFEHPDIILLDEPTNALDEEGVQLIYKILKEEKDRGACIVISSHNKNDFSNIVDEVIKISDGKMIL